MNSGGGQNVPAGWGCLRGPWTVIYGSVVDVLMDWAHGAYPSQVWSPIPGMDMLRAEQHIIKVTDNVLDVYKHRA